MDFKGNLFTEIREDCGFLWISIRVVFIEEENC